MKGKCDKCRVSKKGKEIVVTKPKTCQKKCKRILRVVVILGKWDIDGRPILPPYKKKGTWKWWIEGRGIDWEKEQYYEEILCMNNGSYYQKKLALRQVYELLNILKVPYNIDILEGRAAWNKKRIK